MKKLNKQINSLLDIIRNNIKKRDERFDKRLFANSNY